MGNKKPTIQEEVKDTAIVLQEETSLAKPENDTKFAHEAAKFLMDIVKQNNWSRRLGGQSEHLQYEAWQTAGKFYGYSVKTFEAEYVELGGTWGFKAKACVVNEKTGIQVGGAEAYCMSDEYNWKSKPKFQLASMAQTRAGSKALRQILGFVVALAGYNPTPAEEMIPDERPRQSIYQQAREVQAQEPQEPKKPNMITSDQQVKIRQLMVKMGVDMDYIEGIITATPWNGHSKTTLSDLTELEADSFIKGMEKKLSTMKPKEPESNENIYLIHDDLGTK